MEFRARLKQSLWNGRVEKKNHKGVLKKLSSIAGLTPGVGLRQELLLSFIVLPTKNTHCSFPVEQLPVNEHFLGFSDPTTMCDNQ